MPDKIQPFVGSVFKGQALLTAGMSRYSLHASQGKLRAASAVSDFAWWSPIEIRRGYREMSHQSERALHVLSSSCQLGLQACCAFNRDIAAAMAALDRSRSATLDLHEARKQIKRARATLRLLRKAIGEVSYRREDDALRTAARQLNEHRDSEVLLRTYERISRKIEGSKRKAGIASLRAILLRAQKSAGRTLESEALPKAQSLLTDVQLRTHRWHTADAPHVLADGLATTYRKGRLALHKAKRSATDRRLHAWRKQAKYTWHQLEILQVLAPQRIGQIARRFSRLSDYIGDDHDLAMLSDRAHACATALDRSSLRTFSRLIKRRRKKLQAAAIDLGERLYRRPPGKFLAWLSQAAQNNQTLRDNAYCLGLSRKRPHTRCQASEALSLPVTA